MATQLLNCEKLLEDTAEEYKRLADAVDSLLKGESAAEEVNATADSVLTRVDELTDNYVSKE